MKILREKRTRVVVAVTLAVLMPLAFGGGPSSAAIDTATGISSGVEERDETPNGGTCPGAPAQLAFTAEARYEYPLDGTPTASFARIEATDSNGDEQVFQGPLTIHWEATTVWDGPGGTTQASPSSACDFGYEWPVTLAAVSGGGLGSTGTISCANAQRNSGTAGSATGSFYSRPAVTNTDPVNGLGQEIVRLSFSSCTMNGVTVNDVVLTLRDHFHAACVDASPTDPNNLGISHCASNYAIEVLPVP